MALAEFRGVSHSFGERAALRSLSIQIREGEVYGLLGPNGAGKTTAVRILCGQLRPTSGAAFVDGIAVAEAPLAARRKMAFVPDGAPLYANLSPLQHLQLVGRLFGMDEGAIAGEAVRLLDGLGLGERRDDPVGQFSRGMRQKTALACAILPRPKLLVLDEPLEGLDAPTTAMVKELLREWARGGRSVLYTSHQLDVVERVCDRMAILHQGALVAEGTLEELRAQSASTGGAATLDQVFRAVTHAEDPLAQARRVLGRLG
ncbi:MAG: ABC transporter ATP-binding protein [Planctomycetes bacterium]|jgi:ABC-2 type transport system ATP-binding protein|nr:ABC transporter ATP-binding protein [Planctomycetota bacterium]